MQPRSIEITHTAGRINLDAGRDALGAAKRCIAGVAWTIDELRAATEAFAMDSGPHNARG